MKTAGVLLLIMLFLKATVSGWADVVETTNGNIYKGTITKMDEKEIIIKTAKGIARVPRSQLRAFQSEPPPSGASGIIPSSQTSTTQKGIVSTLNERSKEPLAKSLSSQRASMSGTVAVVSKSGDVRPIVRRWFMVLPFSPFELTNKQGKIGARESAAVVRDLENEKASGYSKLSESQSKLNKLTRKKEYLEGIENWLKNLNVDELERLYENAEKENRAFKFQTDLQGQYQVVNIPPGKYYISDGLVRMSPKIWEGYKSFGRCYIHWEFVITLAPGQSLKGDLSNDNAYDIWCLD